MTSTWTKEKPTKPGWYWWRAEGYDPSIHHVCIEDDEPHVYYSDNGDDLFEDFIGEWSSQPIEEPEEA